METNLGGRWRILGLNCARHFETKLFKVGLLSVSNDREHHISAHSQEDIQCLHLPNLCKIETKTAQRPFEIFRRSSILQLEASATWPSNHVGSKPLTSFGLRGLFRTLDSSSSSTSTVIDIRMTFQLFQKHRCEFYFSSHHADHDGFSCR